MRIALVLLCLLSVPVLAEDAELYDDPRVVAWSKAFLDGERAAAVAAVEKDLRSDAPHPLAAFVWTELQGERLSDAWAQVKDDALRRALTPLAEIRVLYDGDRSPELLERFPAAKAGAITDLMALSYLTWAAFDLDRYEEGVALGWIGLQRRPDRFAAVWSLWNLASVNDAAHARIAARLAADGALAATPAGRTLKRLVDTRPLGSHEKIRIADAFLAEQPGDVRALRFRALSLKAVEKHDEAAADYARVALAFPFRNRLGWLDHAQVLIARERYEEALQVVTRAAALYGKPADQWFAHALITEQHLGKAREVLDVARAARPDDGAVRNDYARLEMQSRRYAHAVPHARAAAAAMPHDREVQRRLVDALRQTSGGLETALKEFQRLEERPGTKSASLYYTGVEIMLALERPEDAVAVARRAVAALPGSAWMQRTLARVLGTAGEQDEARTTMVRTFEQDAPTAWSIGQLRSFGEADGILAAQRRRYPWCRAAWADLATRADGFDAKLAVWREAAQKNPGRHWPLAEINTLLVNSKRYDEALAECERAVGILADAPQDDRVDAALDFLWTVKNMILNRRANAGHVGKAFAQLERFRDLGGPESKAQSYRAVYLSALGRRREAGAAYMRLAELDPSVSNVMGNLFETDSEIGPRKWIHVRRCLDRNPYDGDRLETAAERHLQWGGGTVTALLLYEVLKERAPDTYRLSRFRVAKAYGALGDHVRHYGEGYASASAISSSALYVSWYESTRVKAQGPSARVTLDVASRTAVIVHPDGRVERRREHPITGRPTYWQIGAAFVEVDYHPENLELAAIRTSSGERVSLDYDENGRITRLATTGGRTLEYEYDERGKPVRIVVVGLGEMTVAYDDKGEITNVESPDGHKMALRVQESMQKLLRLTQLVDRNFRGELPELPHRDAALDALDAAFREALARAQLDPDDAAARHAAAAAGLALAEHLVAHVEDREQHGARAVQIARGLLGWHDRSPEDATLRTTAARAALLWHRLLRVQREAGLTRNEWVRWNGLVSRMETLRRAHGDDEAIAAFSEAVRREPLHLLETARWLPHSPLVNRGFWRRYAQRQVVPATTGKDADLRCVLVRGNGDVVVGTAAGLAVLRRGYWEWFGFDDKRGRFSASVEPGSVSASSEILALAESNDGMLWLGTANGLVALANYAGPVRRWRTTDDGLPTPRVEHLAAIDGAVVVGCAKGLLRVTDRTIAPVTTFAVRFAKGANGVVLVGALDGLYACGATGTARKVADGAVDAAVWHDERLLVLDGVKVFAHAWDGAGAAGPRRALRGQENIVVSKVASGLVLLPLDEETVGAAVLTDQGLSIHHDNHFEHLRLPLADRTPGVRALATGGGRTVLLTTDGVYVYERGRVMGDTRGVVYDLLGCDDFAKTFVARGDRLEMVDHAEPGTGAVLFDNVPARYLARGTDGSLLVATGRRVLRYAQGRRPAQVLFESKQTVPERYRQDAIGSLLAASDGSIWVTAGASVFRFHAGEVDEFSIYKDAARFPAASDMIARVVETKGNEILVAASNNGHRRHRGRRLTGGVLRFVDDRFEMTDLKRNGAWFLSSYTRVGPDEAIVGTAKGFARHRGSRYATFASLKDTSYSRLAERTPQLFLATHGAKLGDDVWLFGTGGGVVAWRAGQWFFPDRLNWMLPDPHLAHYGSRAVRAVATDAAGRIYAGTDRGLLIYDSGGGDAVSFLVSSDLRTAAFVSMESDKLQREADILLTGLKPDGAMAKAVKRYRKSANEIVQLKQALETGVVLGKEPDAEDGRTRKQAAIAPGAREQLAKRLVSRERTHRALLARLERENLGLFQMLELKPLDLAAIRKKLAANQAVVQYLPTPRTLFIHVVKRDSIEVREVDVTSKELFERTRRAAAMLENSGRGLAMPKGPAADGAALQADLAWLYEQLLRPVEHELEGQEHVFVVPAGPLTYVPFGGLVRADGKRIEYAVERFTFGVLPSMYLLHLALSQAPSTATDALVLGDPDGSLPGARKEARAVHKMLAGGIDVQIGDEATVDNLRANADDARIVHFATHGKLNHEQPEQSYLLLAGGYRLGVLDIQDLPLKEADLVVLSACQTGIGKEGMEFATLARAFAHAGVPTTVATLWSVNDAATRALMQRFYGHLTNGDDVFQALAKAQREAIAAGGKHAAPSMWSGFLPFGRP